MNVGAELGSILFSLGLLVLAGCSGGELSNAGCPGSCPLPFEPPAQKQPVGTGPSCEGLPHESPAGYVVYVESIDVPDRIVAGEPFMVTLEVSAESRPCILRGVDFQFNEFGKMVEDPGETVMDGLPLGTAANERVDVNPEASGLFLLTDVMHPTGGGERVDEFKYRVPGLEAGTWNLGYRTAPSREQGGERYRFRFIPPNDVRPSLLGHESVTIEVEPTG